jgi:peptidase S46-like protein
VVGILFDGNIESLPWNFEYSDKVGRSISVDSRGIMEALRDIYGASRVVQELEKGRAESGKWLLGGRRHGRVLLLQVGSEIFFQIGVVHLGDGVESVVG